MTKIAEKKVLLFAPKFFDYDNLIKRELEQMGAIVHLYDERPNPTSVDKILIRKARFILKNKINKYYQDIIRKEEGFEPDYILFINSEAVGHRELNLFRKKFSNSIFMLYMWDSAKNKKIKQYFGYFDKLYSFDRNDCEKYGMIFRPLFFIPAFEKQKYVNGYPSVIEFDTFEKENASLEYYDISFIGTVHSDRIKIVLKLMEYCNTNDISYYWYLYVPGKLLYLIRWLTDPSFRKFDKKYIHIEPMEKEKLTRVLANSRCVLDINHPKQTGLTMRTIETLGECRKIITTNSEIKNYDFSGNSHSCFYHTF